MTPISDERIREVIAKVESWRVYSDERGMVCDDLALICRAMLAAREEANRLREQLQAVYWWFEAELKDHVLGTPKTIDAWKMHSLLLELQQALLVVVPPPAKP